MTNTWMDIGNASCVLVMGANPSENHPACMSHINVARSKGASLIVVDPRKTRTALQADRYIRIRPGTDIAFLNATMKYIIDQMEDFASPYPQATKDNFFAFLNHVETSSVGPHPGSTGRPFWSDGSGAAVNVLGRPLFTDARFIVDAAGADYERETFSYTGGKTFSNFPKLAPSIDDAGAAGKNTVYQALKAHIAPYTLDTAAAICGCNTGDIVAVANAFIDNSRCSSPGTFGSQNPTQSGYKCLTMLYAMGQTQHTYGSQNVKAFATIQTLMGNMGRAGGGINALRGIHNVQGSTDQGLLYGYVPGYGANPVQMPGTADASGTYSNADHKPTNDANAFGKYMNGLWGYPVHTSGRHTVMDNSYADAYDAGTASMWWQQTGYFNMLTKWFGPYDATGSTVSQFLNQRDKVDALYALWPKRNGDDHITMFREMGAGNTPALVCWGQNPAVTEPNQSAIRAGLKNLDLLVVVDMFETETAACERKDTGVTYLIPACSHVEEAGSVTNSARTLQWREKATNPKGNSKADMELLLRFAKALDDGLAFSHIEATWTRATPSGLGLTKGVDFTSVYANLYGRHANGWDPKTSTTPFESISESIEMWRSNLHNARIGQPMGPRNETVTGSEVVAEHVCREFTGAVDKGGTLWLYTEGYDKARGRLHTGQSAWLVDNRAKSRVGLMSTNNDPNSTLAYPGWGWSWLINRRVLYNNAEVTGDVADYYMGCDGAARMFVSKNLNILNYSRFYRKVHTMADAPDVTVGADGSWGGGYDAGKADEDQPHFINNPAGGKYTLAGRFPAHTEPYESPKDEAFLAKWGRNTKFSTYYDGTDMDETKNKKWNLVKDSTAVFASDRVTTKPAAIVAAAATVPAIANPLILTSIRCVEHFQGGPITRNNSYNVEAEPEPWIEINSADAAARGIVTGQLVNVYTVRGESKAQGTNMYGSVVAQGFRARVGVGVESNQRVGRGLVAIPWHWGDRGLSTGSRANDLCIDAGDANTTIPEYKACLCWIKKA